MKKSCGRVIFLLLLLLAGKILTANIPDIAEIMRHNSGYYYGEAVDEDRETASDLALMRLSRDIEVKVESSYNHIIQESGSGSDEFMEVVVRVVTQNEFRNLRPLINRLSNGQYSVLYYLHSDELNKIYEVRKNEIFTMYRTANEAELRTDLMTSLQLYYYCLILMNALPDKIVEYENDNLRLVIPIRVQSILNTVRFYYDGDLEDAKDKRTILLSVEYKGKPVQSLEFEYIEGGQPNISRVRDGRATCDLFDSSGAFTHLEIHLEYRYGGARNRFPSVERLWQVVSRPSFDNFIKLDLRDSRQKRDVSKAASSAKNGFNLHSNTSVSPKLKQEILKQTDDFLKIISSGEIKTAYKNDPFLNDKLNSLFKYNNPRLIDKDFQLDINPTWTGWELRYIPVSCKYKSLATDAVEYLVLDFDKDGKLVDVGFNIFNELYDNFVDVESLSTQDRQHRQVIVKFLEKYRTAYMNRDMQTLEKIFSDDAVIIVGRVLQEAKSVRAYELNKDEEQIEYLQFTKQEYLNRQKQIFQRQQDIYLGFNTFNILKKDDDTSIYGISMRQQYDSSTYSDEGHLFLLIDFLEKDPTIYVRSWQPGEWTEDEMTSMSDFIILK